jgi:hypothetical protein
MALCNYVSFTSRQELDLGSYRIAHNTFFQGVFMNRVCFLFIVAFYSVNALAKTRTPHLIERVEYYQSVDDYTQMIYESYPDASTVIHPVESSLYQKAKKHIFKVTEIVEKIYPDNIYTQSGIRPSFYVVKSRIAKYAPATASLTISERPGVIPFGLIIPEPFLSLPNEQIEIILAHELGHLYSSPPFMEKSITGNRMIDEKIDKEKIIFFQKKSDCSFCVDLEKNGSSSKFEQHIQSLDKIRKMGGYATKALSHFPFHPVSYSSSEGLHYLISPFIKNNSLRKEFKKFAKTLSNEQAKACNKFKSTIFDLYESVYRNKIQPNLEFKNQLSHKNTTILENSLKILNQLGPQCFKGFKIEYKEALAFHHGITMKSRESTSFWVDILLNLKKDDLNDILLKQRDWNEKDNYYHSVMNIFKFNWKSMIDESSKLKIQELRYFTEEDISDLLSVEVAHELSVNVNKLYHFLSHKIYSRSSKLKCDTMIKAGKKVPFLNYGNTHHDLCWRHSRNMDYAQYLKNGGEPLYRKYAQDRMTDALLQYYLPHK